MIGYLHSRESFGTVDGPGIRYVLFLQGCPMRCQFCHNPDTWKMTGGTPITPEAILAEYQKNRSFYTKGGITVTGGEPLLQIDFLIALFSLAKADNIHTCIDTSGMVYHPENASSTAKLDQLMQVTDLVMLDIKHIDSEKHKVLTGYDNLNILAFARYLACKKVPLWIRHVLIPGITDSPADLINLGRYIGTLTNLKALDVLPYHTLGIEKYRELGLPYPLENTPAATKEEAIRAKRYILSGIHDVRTSP